MTRVTLKVYGDLPEDNDEVLFVAQLDSGGSEEPIEDIFNQIKVHLGLMEQGMCDRIVIARA